MNMIKIKKLLFNVSWIAVSACVAAFFVIALCVYARYEPSGVSESLPIDDTFSIDELSVMSGDLEAYPYVTKVYEHVTDNDGVNVCWVNDGSVWREKIDYGIVADESASYNYYVECFVYSNIADKQLVKRTWSVSVNEGDVLTFVESKAPYLNLHYQEFGDIKKDSYKKEHINALVYNTFFRITVKPGFDRVVFEVKS